MNNMKTKTLFVTALTVFTFNSSFAIENKHEHSVLSNKVQQSERDDRQYEVIELDNKMRVLLVSDPKATKSLGSIALPVGSLYDPVLQQGLAHYTEHMVLMGSKKYPQPSSFTEFLARHAGNYNASTSGNRTAFFFEVENGVINTALDYLADAIAEPIFDPKFADKERNAVNAEMTMYRSSDGFRIQQVDSETINPNHPAAQFSGGNLETLSDKDNSKLQDELVNFHDKYYSANIMVGVIYSNQSIEKLETLAESTYGQIPNKNIIVPPITKPAITQEFTGKEITMLPAQPRKMLSLKFPIENDIDKFTDKTNEYLIYLISNNSKNTLADQLQKQGLIEAIQATCDSKYYGNSGTFNINVILTDEGLAQKDKVIAAIFNYLQLIEKQGVSEAYYDEIKKVFALSFKYKDVNRDMSYVEWLSDQMLLYPVKNVLDADYVAEHLNKEAIINRIKSFTPDNARVWLIAPNQTTDKTAYFLNAPYKVDNISDELKTTWTNLAKDFSFTLPELNPYIPDNFNIIRQNSDQIQPATFSKRGNHIHFVSRHFNNDPKAVIAVSLRNNQAFKDAKTSIAFELLDYIVSRDLTQLQFQAGNAGMSLSTGPDNGLMITAAGFNQHLPEMVLAILNSYRQVAIDEQSLALAKSWYLQRLDGADHFESIRLASEPVLALSKLPHYFERDERRQITNTITISDVEAYRDNLMTQSIPYMISLGNISNEDSLDLYHAVQKTLIRDVEFTPLDDIAIKTSFTARITQQAKSTDSALLMTYFPTNYDPTKSQVVGYTLTSIMSPWFFDQLRSHEQLGYLVGIFPFFIGESVGLGFAVQTNQWDPAYLLQRYQAFYPTMLNKLDALTDKDIEEYKRSIIDEQTMPPQSLDEEFERLISDYRLSRFQFDSRDKKIELLKKITKQDLIDFYKSTVIDQKGLVIASQVIGKTEKGEKEPEAITDYTEFKNASSLQNELLK
ncbi:pitrilysin [Gilliamella apis]|uniref:pitrilysin n=1 Tax=Gilliamella apis TaxID=1970738 RepID=UPI000A330888|nr:pitrilysin [Gilliamella apis]OTQ70621.1 pitrilysin [Gilliamella apis]OTQ73515.1 pitrilysin [Gilliamella apis]